MVKISGLAVDEAVSGLPPGAITLGIRPRAFSLQSEDSPQTITARSEIIEPMGAETLVHARTAADTEIRVVVPRERRVSSGETLHLNPDPGQTHIFDGDERPFAHERKRHEKTVPGIGTAS